MVRYVLNPMLQLFKTLATFWTFSTWVAAAMTLTYQTYVWARAGIWSRYSLATGFEWLGFDLSFLASPAGWHGTAKVSWAVLTALPVEAGIVAFGLGAAHVCKNIVWELEDMQDKAQRRLQFG